MNLVYTAIYGGYDKLWQPKVISRSWQYRVYTDRPLDGKAWKVIQQPLPYGAAKNSKFIKITHPMENFDNILWIDGCVEIKKDLNEFISRLPKGDIVVGSHPINRSLGAELRACISMGKDNPEIMRKQVEEYGDFPIPDFPQNTIILRRKNIPATDVWWNEVKNKSKRDQLSFNWAMYKANQEYSTYPWSLAEQYFTWHKYHNK
ncbi:MAG: DUF616 domain-containing protein [Tissierellales bacterium]|nr:DUF616 domain-containing protein [Tissierellales bacterium]